jgi:sugar lactone lactonase YvrE
MAHSVFICHSTRDKQVADAACSALEAQNIPCWIAPRDIFAGEEYGEAIIDALDECQIVLLIFSLAANNSPQVRREIERAVSKGKIIVPFRIEDVLPSRAMEFALGNTHWLDAMSPPLEDYLPKLCTSISRLLQKHKPVEQRMWNPPEPVAEEIKPTPEPIALETAMDLVQTPQETVVKAQPASEMVLLSAEDAAVAAKSEPASAVEDPQEEPEEVPGSVHAILEAHAEEARARTEPVMPEAIDERNPSVEPVADEPRGIIEPPLESTEGPAEPIPGSTIEETHNVTETTLDSVSEDVRAQEQVLEEKPVESARQLLEPEAAVTDRGWRRLHFWAQVGFAALALVVVVAGVWFSVWTYESRGLLRILKTDGTTYSVAFSPTDPILASGNYDVNSDVQIWNISNGQKLYALGDSGALVHSLVVSADGRFVAWGENPNVTLWDLRNGQIQHLLTGHADAVNSVAFSPDSRTLASGSDDQTIKLWDVNSGSLLRTIKGDSGKVFAVAFSPDGRTLASGNFDDSVKLWDPASGQLLRTLSAHLLSVTSLAFSPDGRTLASGSWDSSVKLWDVGSGQELRTLNAASFVYAVAFSPDGRTVASGSLDSTAKLWDASTGRLLRTLHRNSGWVQSVAFSPDGRTLAAASTGTIDLWDVSSVNK